MQKVYSLVLNDGSHDTRVLKEAGGLAKSGYDVTIIGLTDKQNRLFKEIKNENLRVLRLNKPFVRESRILDMINSDDIVGSLTDSSAQIKEHSLDKMTIGLRERKKVAYVNKY